MTNTKFRKRALLSSVAMLLVALIALGSATFAWFVANPSVTAKGLSMTTSASSGLLIRSESVSAIEGAPFSKETKLDATGVVTGKTAAEAKLAADFTAHASRDLQPVTFDATLSSGNLVFKSTSAKSSNVSEKADEPTWTSPNAQTFNSTNGAYYKEKIYIKTSEGSTGTATVVKASVKITLGDSADTVKNAIRVALVQHQYDATTPTDTLIGVWGPADGQDAAGKKSTESGFAFKTGEANATYANYYVSEDDATTSLIVDNSLANNYFTAYVYLDGYDKQCFSDNVTTSTSTILNGIDITFTKSTT